MVIQVPPFTLVIQPVDYYEHVVEVCRESLEIGLAQVKPGNHIGDIGHAIQQFAESKGCSMVRVYRSRYWAGISRSALVSLTMDEPKQESNSQRDVFYS